MTTSKVTLAGEKKIAGQLNDFQVLAEAKAIGLPLITENAADFNINIGGRALAKIVGVTIENKAIGTATKGLPKLTDIVKAIAKKFIP